MVRHGSRILVATMKDEGPYVLEWIAYHHLIGFDHFVVFTNDCWDSTAEILAVASDALGLVTHVENSNPGYGPNDNKDPQRRAYSKAIRIPRVCSAEYVMVLDADEFLNIHVGDGTLDDLLETAGPFDAMSLTWRIFGSNDVRHLADELVISQFSACLPPSAGLPKRSLGVKTIFHPGRVVKFGVHRPFHIASIQDGTLPIRWLNGAGQDHYEHYRALKWHACDKSDGRSLAEVNHYPVKAAEAFLSKMRRGSSNSQDAERANLNYWNYYNRNDTRDTSIQRYATAIRAQIDAWYKQAPELRTLHNDAVSMHKMIAEEMHTILRSGDPTFLCQIGLTSLALRNRADRGQEEAPPHPLCARS